MKTASPPSQSAPACSRQRRVVDGLERAGPARHRGEHLGERRAQQQPRLVAVAGRGDRARDVGGDVRRRRVARHEAAVGRRPRRDPVDAERAPVGAVAVPGDQVPAPPGVHEPVRLDEAAAACAVAAVVAEAQPLVVAARGRDRGQRPRGRRSGPDAGNGTVAAPIALTRRRSARGRTCSSLASARTEVSSIPVDADARRRAQADGDRDRLLVVEQQRRHRGAGAEPVAAGDAGRGVDRIAERAQPVDVAPDGARRRPRAARRARRPTSRARLQQREQRQQPGGGIEHGRRISPAIEDRN